MPGPKFLTVPDELLEHAEQAVEFFKGLGYRVQIEYFEPGYPNRPTLVCKRQGTTLFVEVTSTISKRKLDDWARYASSCNADTQVAVCVPENKLLSGHEQSLLQEKKLGLYVATVDNLVERMAPLDLALRMLLPEAHSLPMKVRTLFGPIYEAIGRGHWRDAFKDATQVLEEHARRYLKAGVLSSTPRIQVVDKNGNPVLLTQAKIDKMTLGNLAHTFSLIQKPNSADQTVAQVLASVNQDRVNITHHKAKSSTERKLRANVGKHMWAMISALKEICKR